MKPAHGVQEGLIPRRKESRRAMQQIWQKCRAYFGDGFVVASSPLRYNVHICDIERPSTKNENHHYGVELDEDTLPLFTSLGEPRLPPCSCYELPALVKYIDDLIQSLPDAHPGDYSLQTGKGDISPEQVCVYALRDSLCWWAHWHGTLANDRWKILYVAFATIPDDLQVPPRQLVDGSWRYLGYTLMDLREGLLSEGMHPDDVKFAEMCLVRQFILQYLEKIDADMREWLVGRITLMVQFRTITGNTHGVAVYLLAARGARSRGVGDQAVEMSAICDALSLDMSKEILGILQGETTETVAGDRALRKEELRWVYARCMIHLDAQPGGHLLRRYGSSGLHFGPTMDRYLERVRMARWPLTPAMRRMIPSYVNANVTTHNDM